MFVMVIFTLFSGTQTTNAQLRNQWIIVDSSSDYFNFGICYADNDNIITMAQNVHNYNIIKRTNDGGKSWNMIYLDSTKLEKWESFAYPSKDKIIITGEDREVIYKGKHQDFHKEYGLLIISIDSGKTWSKINLDSNSRLSDIVMLDDNYGIARKTVLGNYFNPDAYNTNDSILITEDGWQTWRAVPIPYELKGKIGQLKCFEKNIFFMKIFDYNADKSNLYISEDGGLNWTISDAPYYSEKIKFIDRNTGWAIGRTDTIFKTTNGGQTWSFQRYIEPGKSWMVFTDLDFADEMHGIVVGFDKLILITSDGGETWYRENPPLNIQSHSIVEWVIYPSPDAAYTIYDAYKIIKRTNNKILKAPTIKRKIFANLVPIAGNLLEWDKIEGATHYELLTYKKNRDSTSILATFQYVKNYIVTDTNLTLDTLEYNMAYQFKIRAYNDSLSSEWNQDTKILCTLESQNALSVPDIIYPEPYSDLYYPSKMTMRWSSNENVDSYEMILYETDIISKIILIHETDLKDTSYYVDILSPLTDYILSVRSKRNDTLSEWANSYFLTEQSTDIVESESKQPDNMIKIIPNPATSTCKILLYNKPMNITSMKLYNSIGVELADLTKALQLKYGEKELELNLSSLSNGVYFVVVRDRQSTFSKSFIVIK
ncbi:MAG: hypothetical protein A2220_05590 [Ignavibacteria bacterium RIFOXYA2_FULL_35_10]|nr:MAG: hypothetical protein A2220_05590 [Ignavibacteria bacterium RIFOXYA2_FULL_35_10]